MGRPFKTRPGQPLSKSRTPAADVNLVRERVPARHQLNNINHGRWVRSIWVRRALTKSEHKTNIE